MKSNFLAIALGVATLCPIVTSAQEKKEPLVKYTVLGQFWGRYGNYNPGTLVDGTPKDAGYDIGIRRFRTQIYSQVTERVFFYSQIGMNNFNSLSERKAGLFIHDALGEYAIVPQKFSMGMGLTAWSGLSRFASPSAGTILGLDVPLYQQSTGDQTDQFLRKLSVYAKGKLGKLDYRFAISQPMSYSKVPGAQLTPGTYSNFATTAPKAQLNGYFQYQFLDSEANQTPYMTGTYLGKKRVVTWGAGFVQQNDAMWRLEDEKTIYEDLTQISTDVFIELPTKEDGRAINLYANLAHFDYGKGYLRNQATMNPTNGTTPNQASINGAGMGYPSYGTGTVAYLQTGYKFKDNLIGKSTFMPYTAWQYGNYDRLQDKMHYFDAGVNWLINGHSSKLTLSYQNRPVFNINGIKEDRKGSVTLQYQILIQ